MIYAMEYQDVETADIPGALQQNYYDKGDMHINLERAIVTVLK